MDFKSGNIRLAFAQDVVYERNGRRTVLPLEGGAAPGGCVKAGTTVSEGAGDRVKAGTTASEGAGDRVKAGITVSEGADDCVKAEITASEGAGGTVLRGKVTNIGTDPVVLRAIRYLRVREWEQLRIGDGDFARYRVFRQGRHKNDLPSVFTLGAMDDCLRDASGGMTETGERAEGEAFLVHSDSLTLFHHQGQNLLLGFITGFDSFVDCAVNAVRDGRKAAEGEDALTCGCVSVNLLLAPGKTFSGEKLLLRAGEDEHRLIEEFAGEKRLLAGAGPRKKAPSVFCTWYYYGLTVTYEDVMDNLREIVRRKLPFDVYQVDEGWEVTLGEWEPNRRFPGRLPMKKIADAIHGAGMTAGIWTSPFIAHASASVWKEHPEWMLRDSRGVPCEFPMNDTVYRVFDITNPAVDGYFERLYRRLTFDWGFTYHKLDFTRAPILYEDADFFDKTVTLVQAYRRAVKAVRRGMGEDSFLLMCGGLYDPLIGLADGQRMGSDVLSMWVSDVNRDGKALPFTIKQNLLRYYMNEWWSNDPDALMVRRQPEMKRGLRLTLGLLGEEEVKTAAVNQYMGGGLVCSTEPLAEIDEDRLYQLRHVLPVLPTRVRTLELFSGGRFPRAAEVEILNRPWRSHVLINWEDDGDLEASVTVRAEEGWQGAYTVSEFYSGFWKSHVRAGETVTAGVIRPHGCAVFKIEREDGGSPRIIGSNAHFSMGGEVESLRTEGGKLILEMDHRFEPESVYRVLVPSGLTGNGEEKVVQIRVRGTGYRRAEVPV